VGRRAGLDGRKILFTTGIRSRTDQPVAQSLYRLSYPAHYLLMKLAKFTLKKSTATLVHRRDESHKISKAVVESQSVQGRCFRRSGTKTGPSLALSLLNCYSISTPCLLTLCQSSELVRGAFSH